MITYIQIQQLVPDAKISDELKQKLTGYLPKCGPRVLDFLYTFLNSSGADLSIDGVLDVIDLVPSMYEQIQSGDLETARTDFLDIWSDSDRVVEKALLAVVLDIQANPQLAERLDAELLRAFSLLEVMYMDRLLPKEVVRLLSKSALSVAEFTNVAEEVKRYCYIRGFEDVNSPQFREFRQALQDNTETVGTVSLEVAGAKTPPTVGGWIKAFSEAGVGQTITGSYNVAYFLTNHPVAIKLSQSSRTSLAEVLRLAVWLNKPEIYEAEMDRFEGERGDYYESIKEQLLSVLATEEAPQPVAQTPQTVPGLQMDVTPKPITAKPFVPPVPMPEMPVEKTKLGGLTLEEGTNIHIEEEAKRIQAAREQQKVSIQNKLEELRKRNNAS